MSTEESWKYEEPKTQIITALTKAIESLGGSITFDEIDNHSHHKEDLDNTRRAYRRFAEMDGLTRYRYLLTQFTANIDSGQETLFIQTASEEIRRQFPKQKIENLEEGPHWHKYTTEIPTESGEVFTVQVEINQQEEGTPRSINTETGEIDYSSSLICNARIFLWKGLDDDYDLE